MDPQFGIVGLGFMGTEHAERIEDAGGTVAAGADVSGDARERFADSFDAVVYEDYTDVWDEDVDAVVVTVPNALHEEVAVSALEAGLDVYLEKPVAHDLASAERVARAARRAEGFCTCGFTMRYYPAVEELLDRAAAGEFGTVSHVEARYLRRDGVPSRGWFVDPDLAGGGALLDIGVHVLHIALATLGFPDVEGVFGRTWSGTADLAVEDSATALARCADGATIDLEVSWATSPGLDRSLVVHGSDGGARVDLDLNDDTLEVYDDPTGDADPEAVATPDHNWLAPMDEALVDAVDRGEAPDHSGIEEGLAVQRVADAIYRSDATGDRVDPGGGASP